MVTNNTNGGPTFMGQILHRQVLVHMFSEGSITRDCCSSKLQCESVYGTAKNLFMAIVELTDWMRVCFSCYSWGLRMYQSINYLRHGTSSNEMRSATDWFQAA